MKRLKVFYATVLVVATMVTTSCGSLSNMSNEDAYNIGYGAGTLIRNL